MSSNKKTLSKYFTNNHNRSNKMVFYSSLMVSHSWHVAPMTIGSGQGTQGLLDWLVVGMGTQGLKILDWSQCLGYPVD